MSSDRTKEEGSRRGKGIIRKLGGKVAKSLSPRSKKDQRDDVVQLPNMLSSNLPLINEDYFAADDDNKCNNDNSYSSSSSSSSRSRRKNNNNKKQRRRKDDNKNYDSDGNEDEVFDLFFDRHQLTKEHCGNKSLMSREQTLMLLCEELGLMD